MIETKHLIIRPYVQKDAPEYFEKMQSNSGHLQEYFSNTLKATNSLEKVQNYFQLKQEQWEQASAFSFGIFLKGSNEYMGHISIRDIDWEVPKGEIAYFILEEYSGRNFATESLSAFRDWCVTVKKFNRLYLKVEPKNIGSVKVAIKSSFKKEGLLEKDYRNGKDQLVNVHLFAWII